MRSYGIFFNMTFYCQTYTIDLFRNHFFFAFVQLYGPNNNMICHPKCNSEFMCIRCFTFRSVVCCRAHLRFQNIVSLFFDNKWCFICKWLEQIKSCAHAFRYAEKKREIFFRFSSSFFFDFDRFHPRIERTQ